MGCVLNQSCFIWFHIFGVVGMWYILVKKCVLLICVQGRLNDQKQVFRFLYAIWPKSKDLYPTYLKATRPPRILGIHQVTIKLARLVSRESKVSMNI